MQLQKQDQVFRNPAIFHVDPKSIDLERVLINLYILMKYDGNRPISLRRAEVTLDSLVTRLINKTGVIQGFEEHKAIARKWLESDVIAMVFRGVQGKEAVVAPRPLHLDSYKLRNVKKIRDYNTGDQVFSMLYHTNPPLLHKFKEFLGIGLTNIDSTDSGYDREAVGKLDLVTLVITHLVEGNDLIDQRGRNQQSDIREPLLRAQAHLFCDDLERLLAYKDSIPRHILIDYIKTMMGIHLALYIFRLFIELPLWVRNKQAPTAASDVFEPLKPNYSSAFSAPLEFLIDMSDTPNSRMAHLASNSADQHFNRINAYIQALFAVNVLIPYVKTMGVALSSTSSDPSIREVINLLATPPITFEGYFQSKVQSLFADEAADFDEKPEILTIKELPITFYDKYVELITSQRSKFHRRYLTELLDACCQKNNDGGMLIQGQGRNKPRRFHFGSKLLEILAQLAVLQKTEGGNYRTKVIRINEFIDWLRERYGFVINGLDSAYTDHSELVDGEAFRQNIQALKDRLREIGFYTDLSDASNAQTIKPRYKLD